LHDGATHLLSVVVSLRHALNILSNCTVAHSWGDGVTVVGLSNTVVDCTIHDTGWACTDATALHTGGFGHRLRRNTLHSCGRSALVHRKTGGLEIVGLWLRHGKAKRGQRGIFLCSWPYGPS